jgi:hypothetical protein
VELPSFSKKPDPTPVLLLRPYLADTSAEVSPRTRKVADRLYATQHSYPAVGVIEREEEDIESEIYHLMFVCLDCFYWCREDERHPDHDERCKDCVTLDDE